ncbi:SCO6745 family protein [Streptomyces cinereoruber]|uniref:SCO6745 family protein n=1 Tax=Streptomyces cinereoruber TaxID=67260 RepID=UPI003BF5CFE9
MGRVTVREKTVESGRARQMWHLLEPLHALLYYAPEAFEEAAALGYDTGERWPSYFAWRAAPLGAAGPVRVASAFYSFSPATVARYVPAARATADPADVLAARLRAVDRTHRAVLGEDAVADPGLAEAAALARRAAEAAGTAGRPLAAANAELPWPDAPHLVLWQAATILREHRGDGHLAALLAAGLDPVESLVSFAAVGAAPEAVFASRGWSAAEWSAARERLAARGLVDADGTATDAGRALWAEVERRTDELAAAPWAALGPEDTDRLADLLGGPWLAAIGSGLLPAENTLGIGKI